MADEQYRWLDPETAERLLSGEPLEAVEPAHRDHAERLAKTLESLTAEPPPPQAELPGEAAALAAFRAARTERAAAPSAPGRRTRSDSFDAGLVRIGGAARDARRSRWARPVRFGLAAVLAAGMVGGVAVAAGTGALPTPFDGEEPTPAASVSAAVPPEPPLVSPPAEDIVESRPAPSGSGAPAPGPSASPETTTGGADPGTATGERAEATGRWREAAVSACRDLRDGVHLGGDRRRVLEGAAGGWARVSTYCTSLLRDPGTGTDTDDGGDGAGDGRGFGQDEDDDRGGDGDGNDDRDRGDDDRGGARDSGEDRNGDGRDREGDRRTEAAGTGATALPETLPKALPRVFPTAPGAPAVPAVPGVPDGSSDSAA
ncbi:hypothetical protein [Streptomyces sp. NPDC048002]|uniref:hypothetical protein n=1 Tax=Streptomyces sp. NPDC048002 TaxID=3154344 RepID=UPI00340AEBD7